MIRKIFIDEHKIIFEKRDIWIGVYWKYNKLIPLGPADILEIYICIVPMLPIYLSLYIWIE